MLRDFISLFFPQNCINCQQSLISAERFLCTSCKIDLPLTHDYQNATNDLYQKFAFEPKVKSATAFLYFQTGGITQKLLHELKYKGKKDVGIMLGTWFAPCLSEINPDMIVPVPLHKSKYRRRTFNQSEMIAKGISSVLDIDVKTDILVREIATQSQTRKSRVDRWKNMDNVYSKASEVVSGKSVLVVDDVVTTGATIGMLCERLVTAGVAALHIATIARGK